MRKRFFRTKYLTGSHIQMTYLRLLMISIIVPLIFVVGCLYYLMFKLMASQIGIPEYIAYHLTPVLQKINIILLIGSPILLGILLVLGIVVSHRFAGPLERLEAELEKIADKGDYKHRIHLRKSDDVKPLADAINKLLDKLEGRHR
jgi:methyl-accepting chemotaxis protein